MKKHLSVPPKTNKWITLLTNMYFNPKHPASFGSIEKLYKTAKNKK